MTQAGTNSQLAEVKNKQFTENMLISRSLEDNNILYKCISEFFIADELVTSTSSTSRHFDHQRSLGNINILLYSLSDIVLFKTDIKLYVNLIYQCMY